MPNPKGAEKGQRNQYQVRYNAGAPCIGVWTSKDISTLPDTALVEGINIRIQDGVVVNRGGQTGLLDAEQEAMTGCVTGLIDLEGLGVNLLLNPAAQLDTYLGYLASADRYERITTEILTTDILRVHPTQTDKGRYCFAHWRGNIVLFAADPGGTYWILYKLIPPETGNEATEIQVEEVLSLPAGVTPSSIVVFPASQGTGQSPELEPIFIGTQEGGVYGFDGIELKELLAATGFASRVIVFRYHDMLYAAGQQEIQRWLSWTRGTGSPLLGTWEAVTLPSDPFPDGVGDFIPTCAAEYLDYGFVGGWDADETPSAGTPGPAVILQLAESAAGVVTCTVGHAVTDSDYVFDLAVFNGTLTYGSAWESSFASHPGRLGGWDGSTWNEELASLTAENDALVFRLFSVGDRMYMGAVCENGALSGEPAGLFEVTPANLSPLANLSVTRLVDTFDLLSDAEGASDIVAW